MTEPESRAWLALIATTELLPVALDAQLRADSGISHFEFLVLTVLKQEPENRLRMTDLAIATNATLPRLSKVVTRLARRGLVEKLHTDGRQVDARLTAEGRRLLVHAIPGHLDLVRHLVLDGLSEQQLATLASALEPVVARLDPHRRLGLGVRQTASDAEAPTAAPTADA